MHFKKKSAEVDFSKQLALNVSTNVRFRMVIHIFEDVRKRKNNHLAVLPDVMIDTRYDSVHVVNSKLIVGDFMEAKQRRVM